MGAEPLRWNDNSVDPLANDLPANAWGPVGEYFARVGAGLMARADREARRQASRLAAERALEQYRLAGQAAADYAAHLPRDRAERRAAWEYNIPLATVGYWHAVAEKKRWRQARIARDALAVELANQGQSDAQIARQLAVSRRTVQRILSAGLRARAGDASRHACDGSCRQL